MEEKINPFNLKKSEILELFKGRCKHGHTYAEHPACYTEEQKVDIRVGYIDIETSNLKANFGIVLSYAIKEKGKNTIYSRCISKRELRNGTLDKKLISDCIRDMKNFDVLMGYYSSRFDIPFLRSRALYWNLKFPIYGELMHKDIWYMVRTKLCLHSNRLETACQHLGIKGKTHMDGTYWITALTGNEEALKYILEHNKMDVIILEKLHDRIKQFAKDGLVSI